MTIKFRAMLVFRDKSLFAIERKLQFLIFRWCEDMWGPSMSLIVPNCNDRLEINPFIYNIYIS
jgi:hypothetical protein